VTDPEVVEGPDLNAREDAMVGRTSREVLTDQQRREIARRLDAGERAADLAQEFGIAREYVHRAARRGRST
jgi:CENP-B-like protein